MKKIILLFIVLTAILSLNAFEYNLPKVLFITTGDGDGRGTVSDGVILALQEFNKLGAFVRLENRNILHDSKKIAEYSILILPTTYGYHDADRRYSLSFLSNNEMMNIKNWVKAGGTLISDVFLGRNKLNGEDRIDKTGKFTAGNWPLAECFGVDLTEINVENFYISKSTIDIWEDDITDKFDSQEWIPVVTNITSNQAKILANWKNDEIEYPAIVQNNYFAGNAVLLANFTIIHPASDGGFSNTKEIQGFYNYIYNLAVSGRKQHIYINPWKFGAQSAFCLTFDAGGSSEANESIINMIQDQKIESTFFLSNNILPAIMENLMEQKNVIFASNSYSNTNFRTKSYAESVREILENSSHTAQNFAGFRFPLTNNSFWGLKVLDELDYVYDSSIGVNHLEFYRGSLFPYNIPIFKDGYYQSLNLLEISQIFHDDGYYFRDAISEKNSTLDRQKSDASRFNAYLKSMWERAIIPNHGLMVIQANPLYSGKSEATIQPLIQMIELAKSSDSWLTNLEEVAQYWNKLKDLQISIKENGDSVKINFSLEESTKISNLSLKLPHKPSKVNYTGKYSYTKNEVGFFIVLDVVENSSLLQINF